MIKKLMPDRMFDSFRDITPEFLEELGVKALLLDIDNTLVTYEDPDPTEEVVAWLKSMNEHGIQTAFISNNSDPARVERFNRQLGYLAQSRAKKPLPGGFMRALEQLGVSADQAASVGDQIFTDVWAARSVGAYALLVPPINDKKTLFFRVKRLLERPIIRRYKKK